MHMTNSTAKDLVRANTLIPSFITGCAFQQMHTNIALPGA